MTAKQRMLRAGRFVADALSGRLGVLMMTLSYAALAVVLFGYVSTHVYTSSLMEDIAARERQRRDLKEQVGRLTGRYASLSSRARISSYCEERLGMVEGDASRVVRVVVDAPRALRVSDFLSDNGISVPDVLGSQHSELSRVMQKGVR